MIKNKKHIISKYDRYKNDKKYDLCFADIETIIDGETHKPVCISILHKENIKTFSIQSNLNDFFFYLEENFENPIVYFHNFGRFDAVFILKNLITEKNYNIVKIIERNNIVYEVKLKKIKFRDSKLMLPLSLKDIGTSFCEKYKKSEFEYGEITELYKKDPNSIIKQCENDCRVLQEGFLKFRSEIYEQFGINIENHLTIPSLSLKIFKRHFYNIEKTPISTNPYNFDEMIRRSYFGGISEVFYPHLRKDGYCYDVNSLYPFIMKSFKFPIGEPKFIDGDKINIDKFIGFIECNVFNENEKNTLLPFRDEIKGLITPVGQ